MRATLKGSLWFVVALIGATAFGVLALHRGESIGAAWLLTAALCSWLIGYRFYARFIEMRVVRPDARLTPAHLHEDGLDYVPTQRFVLFGHHFAAIAGAGPLIGPVLA